MFLFIVLIIVICLLVLLLAYMKMNVFDKSFFLISRQCFILLYFYISVFFNSFLTSIYVYSIHYISYKVMFSISLSSSVLSFSVSLFLFLSFFLSLSQSVSFYFCYSFSFSFTLYHSQSLNDIA